MYVVGVVGTVALTIVGIFTVQQTVGGSSNNCSGGAVCGDGNDGNRVGVPGQGG
ncbi:hypothetical protein IQ279_20160 [Streptomyces verrucosisporus]|uniref:hypothetical protein n=1 Tax=Streptomyces verrucosisporus TaxID=1695161 RepID=UPI0019D1C359|nr:hypothetical protein [Streptomyces verrucosisporus]MBN3931914.1 hypothetical protein [Streptomyces verrucosisporus]